MRGDNTAHHDRSVRNHLLHKGHDTAWADFQKVHNRENKGAVRTFGRAQMSDNKHAAGTTLQKHCGD